MSTTATTTGHGFALLSRTSRKGKWKLHGVFPTHDAAWEASAALPKNRPHVWITRATTEHVATTKPAEDDQ